MVHRFSVRYFVASVISLIRRGDSNRGASSGAELGRKRTRQRADVVGVHSLHAASSCAFTTAAAIGGQTLLPHIRTCAVRVSGFPFQVGAIS
jgi:hypothetical protein